MKPWHTVLVVLVAAVALTSVAAAGPYAAKQRVAINVKFHESTFVLSPFRAGAVKRDSGMTTEVADDTCREMIRDGQEVGLCKGGRTKLTGKRGTLTIGTVAEWVDSGNAPCGVAFGTWRVVRGTGQYAGITGGGRSAYEAHCSKWYARHEGFLTIP
jgi:hypothetical protein